MPVLPRLMLVTDRRRSGEEHMVDAVAAALAAGDVLVQVREKDLSDPALEALVHDLVSRTGRQDLFIVNGRPDVATACNSGLHLPAMQCGKFNREGLNRPLGCSVHDARETETARTLDPDYLVAGTVFSTPSKPGVAACGLAGLERLVARSAGLPVFAIGGMTPERVPAVLATGAYGVAASSAVLQAADPAREVRRFLEPLTARDRMDR